MNLSRENLFAMFFFKKEYVYYVRIHKSFYFLQEHYNSSNYLLPYSLCHCFLLCHMQIPSSIVKSYLCFPVEHLKNGSMSILKCKSQISCAFLECSKTINIKKKLDSRQHLYQQILIFRIHKELIQINQEKKTKKTKLAKPTGTDTFIHDKRISTWKDVQLY